MNENLTITGTGKYYQEELLEQTYESALQLHSEIVASGQAAAYSLVQMCTKLKMMRDQKLYLQLGHETFDAYCEDRAGIKARQAYTYIQLLERLPKDFLQSNASLGVTKLSLLAQLPAHELEEFTEVNDINEISTRRLEELIAENKRLTEQLSLFQNAQDAECPPEDESPEDSERVKELEAQVAELKDKKKEADRKFKEYKTNEESRIAAQVEAQVAEKASAAAAEKIAEEKAKIESAVKQEYEFKIASLTKEMNTASERAVELEKQLKLADSTTAQFQIYFTAVQEDFNKMFTVLSSADEEVKVKLTKATLGLIAAMQQKVGDAE